MDPFGSLSFRVAEYHKPEYQVRTSADKPNALIGEQVKFSVDAAYYSGGNLANAQAQWFMKSEPYYFNPAAKYRRFSFSDWDRDLYYESPASSGSSGTLAEGQAALDGDGHLEVNQTLDLNGKRVSQVVTFNANVTDVGGNAVSGGTSVAVRLSQFYAGIRSLSYVGRQGEEQPFEVVVLDWDSKPAAGQPVTVKFVERQWFSVQKQNEYGRLSWVTGQGKYGRKTASRTGRHGAGLCSAPKGGVYKAIVTVRDAKGNLQQASTYLWVAGPGRVSWRQTDDRSFSVIADKDLYQPGETAELLIAQPFEGSVYALVTYERGHVYLQDVVLLNGNSTIYKLPVTAAMAPLSYVSVVVVSGATESQPPDFKIGMTVINVEPSQQTLDVQVKADEIQPAGR
jgi:uncharacterized protein YfaS (alpha-2-macroglobulin family)